MIKKELYAVKEALGANIPKNAESALPDILASMSNDEEILFASVLAKISINRERDTVVFAIGIVTNRRFFYAGENGHSSVFLSRPVLGTIALKDIHALSVGKQFPYGQYVSFETKNDDYQVLLGAMNKTTNVELKKIFEEGISQAQKASTEGVTIQAAFSPADEIKKFKELLDSGAITQSEFDAKKKQLLGL